MLFSAFFTLSSAMMFVSIRAIGDNVHTSVKNYHFGVVGVLLTMSFILYQDPSFFAFWKLGTPEYSRSSGQIIVEIVVGVFGWMALESLTKGLSTVKSGTMAAF